MTDENKTPEEEITDDAQLEEVAQSVPAPDEYPEGQAEDLAERVDDGDTNGIDEASVTFVEATEEASEGAVPQAWDKGISAVQEAIETPPAHAEAEAVTEAHGHHDDTVTLAGIEMPIYTAVFVALGAMTALEVVIAEAIGGTIKIPLLLLLAVVKAALVVIFYMHLRDDSRIFMWTLLIPTGVALVSILYLLAVPSTGYSF